VISISFSFSINEHTRHSYMYYL